MKKIVCVVMVCLLSVSTGFFAQAAEDENPVKIVEFKTLDKKEKYDFPESFADEIGKYKLVDVTYSVVDAEDIKASDVVSYETQSDVMDSEAVYTPPQSIQQDGTILNLQRSEERLVIKENDFDQEVMSVTEYDYGILESQIPMTKEVTIQDRNGEDMEVVLPLESIQNTESKWMDTSIDIIYSNYGADYYIFGNVNIPHNDMKPALQGYEGALLDSCGLSSAEYRIVDINWAGEPYNSNGIVCRNAIASAQQLVSGKRATYRDIVKQTGIQKKMYINHYIGTKEIDTGKTMYTIKATAQYSIYSRFDDSSKVIQIVISTASATMIIVLVVVITLYLITRNRRKKKENKNV